MALHVAPQGRFQQIEWVDETGSTNDDLLARAAADPASPLVRFTDLQTAGRGRRDRSWEMAPGGGLLVSFFVPWTDRESAHLVPTCLGIAAVEATAEHGVSIGLKWPNDLVTTSGKKLGGMLSTAVLDGTNVAGVVAGLGCNVSWPDEEALLSLPNATSLEILSGAQIDRSALAESLVRTLDAELDAVAASGPSHTHERYRLRCLTIGQQVRVEQRSGDLIGIATDIDPSGALLLDVDGVQRRVDVGDVVHLRPH